MELLHNPTEEGRDADKEQSFDSLDLSLVYHRQTEKGDAEEDPAERPLHCTLGVQIHFQSHTVGEFPHFDLTNLTELDRGNVLNFF